MAKSPRPVRDYGVYLVVRIFVCVLQSLPFHVAESFSRGLAWLLYRVNVRHRKIAAENLRLAFPDWTDSHIDRVVRGVYAHFSLMLVEMFHAPRRIHAHTLDDYITYPRPSDFERIVGLLNSGRPLIFLSGHLGNWEIYMYAFGVYGAKSTAIARPLDNPYLHDYLYHFRVGKGHRVVAKKGEFDQIQKALERGEFLAALFDQDAGDKGLFVDFFGRPASTNKSLALLSLQYKAPILVGASVRVGSPMKYNVFIDDIVYPEEYDNQAGAVKAITQRCTTALERLVRRNPDQYFWLHRRWKHQPKVKPAKKAA